VSAVVQEPTTVVVATPRADAWAGVRAMVPIVLAYAPLGLLVGGHVAASSDPWAAWLGTWLIFGGAAQLAVLDVLSHDSGWLAATIVGLLVNLRLAAFSTAMVPWWRSASLARRIAAGVMLTDAPWAVARTRVRGRQEFYLGAAIALFVMWPLMVTVGVLVGGQIDGLAVTSLLVPLTLGALVVPQLRERPAAAAMAAAACCAVLTLQMSAGVSLALSGLVGAAAALMTERAS
jgi:predicted branched-subunit amino acid permease